jgi:glycosyltransferase involved in cell wall biosynthesis
MRPTDMLSSVHRHVRAPGPRVAFVLGSGMDEWLTNLGMALDDFCDRMVGSWVFNFVSAFKGIDIDPVVVITTSRVTQFTKRVHAPTGTEIWLFPIRRLGARFSAFEALVNRTHGGQEVMRRVGWWCEAVGELLALGPLAETLRRENCDAMVVQEYESSRFDLCVLIGRRLAIPVVGRCTGGRPQSRWIRPIRRLSLLYSSGILISAKSEMDQVRSDYGVPEHKLLQVFYPIDLNIWFPEEKIAARAALGIRPDSIIAIYHGAIEMHYKGLDTLLDAWEGVVTPERDPRYQLLILGQGSDASALRDRLNRDGRSDVIFRNQWFHDRAEIRRYLSAADVYVFPTRDDVLPVAMTEAMACGLPILTAAARGVPDIFPEGEGSGGVIVPPGSVIDFNGELRRVLKDRDLRKRLAARALQRISDPCFSPTSVAQQLARFLFPDDTRFRALEIR